MPKKTKQSPKSAKPKLGTDVLVNVILDRSGSMSGTASGTISGYNEYISGLKADTKTNYSVSLIQFDSPSDGPELTISYIDKPLAEVPELTYLTYQPRGMTPLYDAIGECIRKVDAKGRAVITVIITDGLENASREFTQDSVKALIHAKEAENWTFIFLAANIDAVAAASNIGVTANNVAAYAQGHENTMYKNLAYATGTRSESLRSSGFSASNTMNFMTGEQESAQMGHVNTTITGRTPTPPVIQNINVVATGGSSTAQSNFRTRKWAVSIQLPDQPDSGAGSK